VSEAGGLVAVAPPDGGREDGAVRPLEGVTVRVGDDGELVVCTPSRAAGWVGVDAAAAAYVGPAAPVHTGDEGSAGADGTIVVEGRRADRIVTAGGGRVVPALIEARLRASPFVRSAVVVGDGRRELAAVLFAEGEAVGAWAADRGLAVRGTRELLELPAVRALFAEAVDAANAGRPDTGAVRAFAVVADDLASEPGALTPSGQVRRSVVIDRYSSLLEGMKAR
jgi:long-chain acyl-CoA synthetase